MGLRIGDKIRFMDDEGCRTVYTITSIDTSRSGIMVHGRINNSHFQIQWKSGDKTYSTWVGDFSRMNQKLSDGRIIIVDRDILSPNMSVKKFNL
jgi:phage protein U